MKDVWYLPVEGSVAGVCGANHLEVDGGGAGVGGGEGRGGRGRVGRGRGGLNGEAVIQTLSSSVVTPLPLSSPTLPLSPPTRSLTSSSFISCTGLKKCSPTNFSNRGGQRVDRSDAKQSGGGGGGRRGMTPQW